MVTLTASASARTATRHAADRLDSQLFEPLRDLLTGRPLVVIATGSLNAMPWSALPTCAERPVTVAPSAAAWLRASRQPANPPAGEGHTDGGAVLVAGPRLPAAGREVATLAAYRPGAQVLTGEQATAANVLEALDGAALAHIAAHGSFRADNPLFSAIEVTDGPLIAYELERLRRAPGCVVLSTCDSAQSTVAPGDELLGFTAALLGLGTRTLIASVLPVPADETVTLMAALHRRMSDGVHPAEALYLARTEAFGPDPDDLAFATGASFASFGAG